MKLKYIIQIIILLAGTLLAVWAMPRKSTSMNYEVNRPWKYPLLTAPMDIPIYPDSIKIHAAIDSINRNFIPVYRTDTQVENKLREKIQSSFENFESVSVYEKIALTNALNRVLDRGIVPDRVYNDIIMGTLPEIRMINRNVITSHPTNGLLSAKEAYRTIYNAVNSDIVHDRISRAHIEEMLEPTLVLDEATNSRLLNELHSKATAPYGVIQKGERIIDQGQVVTIQIYTILQTYESMLAEKSGGINGKPILGWIGKFAYIGLIFALMGAYIFYFRRNVFTNLKSLSLQTGLVAFMGALAFFLSNTFGNGLYLVPLTMIPIILTVFFDASMAIIISLFATMLCSLAASAPMEFIAMQFIGTIISVASLKELSRRSQLVRTAGLVYLGYAATYVAINMIITGSLDSISLMMFAILAINVIFVSFAYVLIFVFERWLGTTSLVGLVELSDINHPILRELSRECPGTFQHSIAVSNLAAEAAAQVGANVQLIRAGALYHDIGKIDNPAFFTENQHGVNPHDALDPLQSARIITGHVTAGLRRAEKAKLPKAIKDFIAQHHGKGVARYFYITYCNQHPNEEVDRTPFTYVGPNPQTLESSILMMADAVEAASRSLNSYTPEAISELVGRIINAQIAEGLHAESPLKFSDVDSIKQCFVQRLLTIYHSRIAYPSAKK
ncbi:MAG: HDIG domain-containing protein [Bacteroidales bacterium]|nr:HDIG domain-containing protein [Bacteroidales bacterium]